MGSIQARETSFHSLPDFDIQFLSNDLYSGIIFRTGDAAERIPRWSIYPGIRDSLMREFWKEEPIISGAIYSFIAKMKSLPRRVVGEGPSADYATDLFNRADMGNGWMTLLEKTVQDLLTQDNGFFWELVGRGNPDGPLVGPPTEVNYLDPALCYRTFDPDYPVLYINPIDHSRHRLHKSRIITDSSMPQPNELARGVGFCALSRALARVRLARFILQHRLEVVTGTQKKAILHGKGVSAKSLRRALNRAETENVQEEIIEHQGIPILTTAQGVDLNLLSLAGLPDGYEMVDEHTMYVYIISVDFGIDAREIWPATVTGASKADASIQHMKARGKGFADILSTLDRAHNKVLALIDPELFIEHDFIDDEQDAQETAIRNSKTDVLKKYKDAGAISAKEMRALGIAEGILDAEILDNIDSVEGMQNFEEEEESDGGSSDDSDGTPPGTSGEGETEANVSGGSEFTEEDERILQIFYKAESQYRQVLRKIVKSLWTGSFTLLEFVNVMDGAVRDGLTEAAYAAASTLGILPTDLTFEERQRLLNLIAENVGGVIKFGQWVLKNRQGINTIVNVYKRVELWVRQYRRVVNLFKTLLGGNLKYIWKWTPAKEHCVDCAKMNGRVYRADIWRRYGVQPQSRLLACGGFNCGCQFVLTRAPVTPGFPPRLSGQKAYREDLGDGAFHLHPHHGLAGD